MRLAKVALLLLAAVVAVSGCSQYRGKAHRSGYEPLNRGMPPRHQEYDPGSYESNPALQPAMPHVPPAPIVEPPRVPPAAVGVSRVKSVGFPRILGHADSPPRVACGEPDRGCCAATAAPCVPDKACVTCPPGVGTCREGCATASKTQCVAPSRENCAAAGQQPCATVVCEGCVVAKKQPSLISKMFSPIAKKFSSPKPGPACTCTCEKCAAAKGCAAETCTTASRDCCVIAKTPCGCGDDPGLIVPRGSERRSSGHAARTSRSPGLAESLQDPFLDQEGAQIPVPVQQLNAPLAPLNRIPQETVPIPPAIYVPHGNTQLVIPQPWPRLVQNAYAATNP